MIVSSLSYLVSPLLLICLLCTSLPTSNAQCTFQGSLSRRDESGHQFFPNLEAGVEEKRSFNRYGRAEAMAHAEFDKRLVCNQDNVLRALKAHTATATPFCAKLINIPTVTKTVSVPGVTPSV